MFGRKNPAGGLYVRHAERVTIDNFVVNYRRQDQRPVVVLDDVHHFEATHLRQDGRAPHLYMLQGDCDDVAVNGEKVNPNATQTSK